MVITNPRTLNTCRICKWQWFSRKIPFTCPHCKSQLWDRERKKAGEYKPRPEDSVSRNKGDNFYKIANIRKANPCATLQSIGDKVGVSRERVRQILSTASLPTRSYNPLHHLVCHQCGKNYILPTSHYKGFSSKLFCSKECKYNHSHILLECEQCHTLFPREVSKIITFMGKRGQQHIWCTKQCQDKWLGEHEGFGVHPEHRVGHIIKKWDYDMVWQKHLETGYGALKLSRLLKIPMATIGVVLHKKKMETQKLILDKSLG